MRFDKSIKIFKIIVSKDEEGNELISKTYIHPQGTTIKAYFRTASEKEINQNRQSELYVEGKFTIIRRAITNDMFFEIYSKIYGERIYQVIGIDGYNERDRTIEVTGRLVTQELYFDKIVYSDWGGSI